MFRDGKSLEITDSPKCTVVEKHETRASRVLSSETTKLTCYWIVQRPSSLLCSAEFWYIAVDCCL